MIAQEVRRDGVLLLDAEVRIAALQATSFRPRAIPEPLYQALNRLVEPGAEPD